MEGLFESQDGGSEIILIGQPNVVDKKLDNKITVPNILSFLTYKKWDATVKGLNEFDPKNYPTNIPGLYYAYHIMVGLGTLFIGLMAVAALQLWRKNCIAPNGSCGPYSSSCLSRI